MIGGKRNSSRGNRKQVVERDRQSEEGRKVSEKDRDCFGVDFASDRSKTETSAYNIICAVSRMIASRR